MLRRRRSAIRIRAAIPTCEGRSRLTWASLAAFGAIPLRCSSRPDSPLRSVLRSGGLRFERVEAWVEEPGYPLTRTALGFAGMAVMAIPVDAEGLDIAAGVRIAPRAALAVVTPGQQAPLGMTMSLPRRLALIEWARRNGAWIIEDDYLSELQLKGRAAPALASLDHGDGCCTSARSARPSARRCDWASWWCRRKWLAGSATSLLALRRRRQRLCSLPWLNCCARDITFAICVA